MATVFVLITAFSAALTAFNGMTGDYATALLQAVVAVVSAYYFEKELRKVTKGENG